MGRWRATYTAGDWLVLCGPTSLVVVEPPGAGWTPLVEELWQQVLASSSLVDLATRLAGYGLDTMPSFGALFWSPEEGMRSLVRGAVTVVDPADERVVASGAGIQTWSEVGLGQLSTVLVRTGGAGADGPETLQLPLVVGAVQASTVLLDAREGARVRSPQLDDGAAATDHAPADPASADPGDLERDGSDEEGDRSGAGPAGRVGTREDLEPLPGTATTEVLADPGTPLPAGPPGSAESGAASEDAATELLGSTPVAPELGRTPAPAPPPPGPTVDAVVCPHGHPNPPGAQRCRDCGVTVTDQQVRVVAQPVLAVLRVSDGSEAPVDRTVLVGRAPGERGAGPVRLLPVPSPAHDISRTHLEVAVDGWRVTVTDLHSTNGTLLVEPDGGRRHTLPPGRPVPVVPGTVLELAEGVSVTVVDPR